MKMAPYTNDAYGAGPNETKTISIPILLTTLTRATNELMTTSWAPFHITACMMCLTRIDVTIMAHTRASMTYPSKLTPSNFGFMCFTAYTRLHFLFTTGTFSPRFHFEFGVIWSNHVWPFLLQQNQLTYTHGL